MSLEGRKGRKQPKKHKKPGKQIYSQRRKPQMRLKGWGFLTKYSRETLMSGKKTDSWSVKWKN